MSRKTRKAQDASSDDDAPEIVSHSTSKADVKRYQKALHDFEVEEKARRKVRNRERDRKLKERACVTKGGKTGKTSKEFGIVDLGLKDEDECSDEDGGDGRDDAEMRMLRAMRDAEGEVESDEEDDGDEFAKFGGVLGSDSSFAQDDDDEDDTGMSLGGDHFVASEAPTDSDEEMDEDGITQPQTKTPRRKPNYLADGLFAAAFASQRPKVPPQKNSEPIRQKTAKKCRTKFTTHPKDLVIGGRTVRMLPRPSDPQSQATTRSVPTARARKFVEQSLALKGKQALLRAKKKGWERLPANVGVMKYQGPPHGFVRSAR